MKYYANCNKLDKEKTTWNHLDVEPKKAKFIAKQKNKYAIAALTRWKKSFHNFYIYQIIKIYTVNISQFCQLYLNKNGKSTVSAVHCAKRHENYK